MRSPTTHGEIENGSALRKQPRIDLSGFLYRTLVDVNDESRLGIEQLIVGVVESAKKIGGK